MPAWTTPVAGRRQRIISASQHSEPMPADIEVLLRRLIGGDDTAPAEILDRAHTSDSPRLLVAAALDAAHLNDDAELLDALVRDHLSDHPDSVLAAWMAAQHTALPPRDQA
jgi:hypothetical protein